LASVPRSGRGGRVFESHHPDFFLKHCVVGVVPPEAGSSRLFKEDKMYFVYILKSIKDHKYYIGSTSNIDARVQYHNSGKQRSTKNRIPFELVYSESFQARQEAERREKQIKSYKGGVAFKRLLGV
jgi:putative endonuclease